MHRNCVSGPGAARRRRTAWRTRSPLRWKRTAHRVLQCSGPTRPAGPPPCEQDVNRSRTACEVMRANNFVHLREQVDLLREQRRGRLGRQTHSAIRDIDSLIARRGDGPGLFGGHLRGTHHRIAEHCHSEPACHPLIGDIGRRHTGDPGARCAVPPGQGGGDVGPARG